MLFRVLGPLSVERRGPALSAPMVRRLLAALLSRPNECVAIDDLVNALWGQTPPPACRRTLQVYVRRLKMALGDESRIIHEAAGYRIVVGPGELDATEFTRLVGLAGSANGEQAVDFLTEALKLWRGNAFEDVRQYPPVSDEAIRADEERLRVEAWHAQLHLDLGRHAEMVPQLTKLAETHPYREDLRVQLMLALYRCGRQTDALQVFRDVRQLLYDELGVEPGPELQRTHEAILRADPSLAVGPRPSMIVPRGLPADITSFVGRVEHLTSLDGMVGDASPIVISAISGSAGVGKTALAVHWAHRVAQQFPDGQLYINLRGFDPGGAPVDPAEAIRHFLDALGVEPQRIPASPEAQGTLFRSLLSDRRMLLVLDNARDAQQIRPLLPGSPSCLTLITSRNHQTSLVATHGARPVLLDVLTESEALDFLVARLGAARVAAEPSAAADIIARCARLPLALAIAAAQAVVRPNVSLEALAAEVNNTDAFASDDPLTDLRAVFSWSYEQLTSSAARLFRLLGLHPGPDTSDYAAANLAALPVYQARTLLSELTNAHLVIEEVPGRYAFHDLLRAYATDLAKANDHDTGVAQDRLLDHYLYTAHLADKLLNPQADLRSQKPPRPVVPEELADHQQAMAWFISEREVLLAEIHLAEERGNNEHVCQMATSLVSVLDRLGHWQDLAAVEQTALSVARRLGDVRRQADSHRVMARAYACMGRYEQARTHLNNAWTMYRQIDDPVGQGHTRMNLANIYESLTNYKEALEESKLALEHYRFAGLKRAEARALNGIGWFLTLLGDHKRGIERCRLALRQLEEIGDIEGQAYTWDSLGHAYQKLGDHGRAMECYQSSIALHRQTGHRHYEADALAHLGDNHQAAGNEQAAREVWQQALTILTELDHPQAEQIRAKLQASLKGAPTANSG